MTKLLSPFFWQPYTKEKSHVNRARRVRPAPTDTQLSRAGLTHASVMSHACPQFTVTLKGLRFVVPVVRTLPMNEIARGIPLPLLE